MAIYDSFVNTAHYHSSEPATSASVKGNFQDGHNVFYLNNFLRVEMGESAKGMYQAGYQEDQEFIREPIDLVIGSGQKGQTYLYWRDQLLFELPVSYFTALNGWCLSPGYPDNQILFNRQISIRCLECHATFARTSVADGKQTYERAGMMLRIGCERCHGPSADHVRLKTLNTGSKTDSTTINPAHLNRLQKLDNCALCHSGLRENKKSPFSFLVGEKLEDFSLPDYRKDSSAKLDVHGNQYGLLLASQCFIRSGTMDCSSCHNTHKKEKGLTVFSKACLNCHQPGSKQFCTVKEEQNKLLGNCIDCHMPKQLSDKILMQVADRRGPVQDTIRTHLIGIYLKDKGSLKLASNSR